MQICTRNAALLPPTLWRDVETLSGAPLTDGPHTSAAGSAVATVAACHSLLAPNPRVCVPDLLPFYLRSPQTESNIVLTERPPLPSF